MLRRNRWVSVLPMGFAVSPSLPSLWTAAACKHRAAPSLAGTLSSYATARRTRAAAAEAAAEAAAAATAAVGCTRSFATSKDHGKRTSAPSAGPLCSKPPSPLDFQKKRVEKWFAAAAAALVLRQQQLQRLQQQQQQQHGSAAALQQPQQLLFRQREQELLRQYKARLTEIYGEVYVHREWPLLRFAAEKHFTFDSKP
ncbi:hypothetical protein Efla_004084 [Eimeria flavescens]